MASKVQACKALIFSVSVVLDEKPCSSQTCKVSLRLGEDMVKGDVFSPLNLWDITGSNVLLSKDSQNARDNLNLLEILL